MHNKNSMSSSRLLLQQCFLISLVRVPFMVRIPLKIGPCRYFMYVLKDVYFDSQLHAIVNISDLRSYRFCGLPCQTLFEVFMIRQLKMFRKHCLSDTYTNISFLAALFFLELFFFLLFSSPSYVHLLLLQPLALPFFLRSTQVHFSEIFFIE